MSVENKRRHLPEWMKPAAGYILLDTVCTGAGMGVPIFNILLGFPVGWFLGHRSAGNDPSPRQFSRNILAGAFLTAGWTFILMLIIWMPAIRMLFDPSADLAGFGIPLILYEAQASFIGWLLLMVVISPFLQVLTTVFGGTAAIWAAGAKDTNGTAR